MMKKKRKRFYPAPLFMYYKYLLESKRIREKRLKSLPPKLKSDAGFIALTSVLIIGAIVLVLGVSLFHSGLTDYSISTAYESGQKAAFLADFCLREGALKLKEDIHYKGGEEIEVNGMTCSIGIVEDIDDNTKKVSSLGRAGEQPHFSRKFQLMRYIVESEKNDWSGGKSENLEITEEGFLKLKGLDDKIIPNSPPGESCYTLCPQGYQCIGVGTDPAANDRKAWTAFEENEEYSCIPEEGVSCGSIMSDHSQELSDCYGYPPDWTYCKCEQGETVGDRISPEFDISGPYTVKDSQIFWQADERFDGTISVKVRISHNGGSSWPDWETVETVANGASILGLELGTSLSDVKIQTKTSFVGSPYFYPSLENIKIFVELE